MLSETRHRSRHVTPQIFSVDVEEYFQVHAFEGIVPQSAWASMPSRVAIGVDRLLDLLARHEAKGTFFVLGWVAERHARLVRRIAEAGHEIASHGWTHRRVTDLAPEEFREEIRSSKALLEDITGTLVLGYRAPSFSITPSARFAFDILLEEGYRYDSSIFPIWRPGYGWRGAPAVPHLRSCVSGTLVELPVATTTWGAIRIPAGGGGYLRQFPFSIIHSAFREHSAAGIPGMFYLHPWELDPDQPRLPAGRLTRIRHYRGLSDTGARLQRLLEDFPFTSVQRVLQDGRLVSELAAVNDAAYSAP
jgi:polysaccharide deacetylase family protein (PEP-CTERM system associated)